MADWAQWLQPKRDYLADARGASANVSQKLSLKKPMPVEKSVGAAAIEGAVGGGLAAFSAMGAMGMPGGGSGGDGVKTPAAGLKPKTKGMSAAGPGGAIEAGTGATSAAPVTGPGGSGLGRFFNWAW